MYRVLVSLCLVLFIASCTNSVSPPDGLSETLSENIEGDYSIASAQRNDANLTTLSQQGVEGLVGISEVWCITFSKPVILDVILLPDTSPVTQVNTNQITAMNRNDTWIIYGIEAYDWDQLLCNPE